MHHTVRAGILSAAAWAATVGLAGSDGPTAFAPPEPLPAVTSTVAVSVPPAFVPGTILAPYARHVGRPTRVAIPAIGVSEPLYGVGLRSDGAMQTPAFGDAGWYDLGPRPGAPGPAVLVAHVHGPDGDDVFARLHELEPGDRVTVRRTDGSSTFVVDAVEQTPKESLPHDRIWAPTGSPVLRLITCGGVPDPVTRMYPDNTVVYAHLAD